MSTVKANNVQVGQSGTASQNFTLYQPSTPDGTVRLAVGNSGATTGDVLSVSSTGLSVTGTLTSTGVNTFPAGSASAPSITTTGDTNTGVFFPAADTAAITTGGTERMRVTSGGNLLVATTSNSGQSDKLHVDGNIGITKSGGTAPQINFYSSSSTIDFVNRNSGGAKTFSWYYGASGDGAPGTLSTSGVWTNASDARGKENISDIHYGVDAVMALQPRQYDVKSDGSHAVGFIAQEVLPVIPELVHVTKRDGTDEFYGLDYGSMTAVLVKAIQEQQTIIIDLQSRIAALEAK